MTPGFNDYMGHVLPYAANCTLLFTEVELLQRPAAARAAGFDAIEFWWPWPDQPVPTDAETDTFIAAVRDAGVQLIGLNFFAGDLAGADCGVLSIPSRSSEFRDNIAVAMGIGEPLGVPAFNALYGNRVNDVRPEQQEDLATENLTLAAKAAAAIGGTVLLEPVSGPEPYPLRTAVMSSRSSAGCMRETSASAANCSISRTMATTLTRRWPRTPTASPMCRSPIIRDAGTRHRDPRPRSLSQHHCGQWLLRLRRSRVRSDHDHD